MAEKKIKIFFALVIFVAFGFILFRDNLVLAQDFDCGLRVRESGETVSIACEPSGTLTSALRIRKGVTTFGVRLVATTDALASKFRIRTSSGIMALKKLVIPPSGYLLYVTATTYTGNLGGRSGADTKCNTDANKPAACAGAGWAFISVSDTDEIRDMPTTKGVVTTNPWNWARGTARCAAANNWADLLDGSIANPGTCVGYSDSMQYTGSTSAGAVRASYNCNGWTNATSAYYDWEGRTIYTDYRWIDWSYYATCEYSFSINCACETTELFAPSGLTATAVSSSQINLAWTDNSGNETGFEIERCAGSGCTAFALVHTTAANAISWPNTGLAAGTLYRYRVRACSGAGCSGYSNIAEATTTTCIATGGACTANSDCCSTYCYRDADGDGYAAASGDKVCKASASLGTDCNDTCATCFPGSKAYTIAADGLDQDCDGSVDEDTYNWAFKDDPGCSWKYEVRDSDFPGWFSGSDVAIGCPSGYTSSAFYHRMQYEGGYANCTPEPTWFSYFGYAGEDWQWSAYCRLVVKQ